MNEAYKLKQEQKDIDLEESEVKNQKETEVDIKSSMFQEV